MSGLLKDVDCGCDELVVVVCEPVDPPVVAGAGVGAQQ
jgi:hypothetical protein